MKLLVICASADLFSGGVPGRFCGRGIYNMGGA